MASLMESIYAMMTTDQLQMQQMIIAKELETRARQVVPKIETTYKSKVCSFTVPACNKAKCGCKYFTHHAKAVRPQLDLRQLYVANIRTPEEDYQVAHDKLFKIIGEGESERIIVPKGGTFGVIKFASHIKAKEAQAKLIKAGYDRPNFYKINGN